MHANDNPVTEAGHDDHLSELGCIIDASHFSALYLDVRVVDFAAGKGFPLSDEDWQTYGHAADVTSGAMEGSLATGARARVYWIAEDALAWLNDQADEGYSYYVEDNSLYLHQYEQDEQF